MARAWKATTRRTVSVSRARTAPVVASPRATREACGALMRDRMAKRTCSAARPRRDQGIRAQREGPKLVPGLSQKYVELLKEVLPSASRFAVISSPPNPMPDNRRELEAAVKALAMSVSFLLETAKSLGLTTSEVAPAASGRGDRVRRARRRSQASMPETFGRPGKNHRA